MGREKIIVLSSNHKQKDESKIFTELFEEGLSLLHLRKHGYPTKSVAKIIDSIPDKFHKRIALHSHYELTKKFDLNGIHITRKKKSDRLFMNFGLKKYIRNENLLISTSYHSTRKIENSPSYFDYFFLNSLFGSIQSDGKHSYKDKDKLEEFLRITQKDIVPLGGIDTVNIAEVKEIGFKSVAFHGAIWGFDNPVERFCTLRDLWLK